MSGDEFWLKKRAPLCQHLLAGEVAGRYLSGQDIRVDGVTMMQQDTFSFPFATLSALEFVHLFAVFNGSRVHVQPAYDYQHDDAPPGLCITVINRQLIQNNHKNTMIVFMQSGQGMEMFFPGLHINHFFLHQHTSQLMLGTVAFALSAITAYKAGIRKISLVAAGGINYAAHHIGYKVWPKFGFDAPLEAGETAGAAHLAGCLTVQQVIARDKKWWSLNGSQRRMEFDLAKNSASWKILLNYLEQKMSNLEAL